MSLKAQIEAVVYAAETPVTLEQITQLTKATILAEDSSLDDAAVKSRVRATL